MELGPAKKTRRPRALWYAHATKGRVRTGLGAGSSPRPNQAGSLVWDFSLQPETVGLLKLHLGCSAASVGPWLVGALGRGSCSFLGFILKTSVIEDAAT